MTQSLTKIKKLYFNSLHSFVTLFCRFNKYLHLWLKLDKQVKPINRSIGLLKYSKYCRIDAFICNREQF